MLQCNAVMGHSTVPGRVALIPRIRVPDGVPRASRGMQAYPDPRYLKMADRTLLTAALSPIRSTNRYGTWAAIRSQNAGCLKLPNLWK